MPETTEALCAPLGGLLVSFPVGCHMLGIPLRTAERMLRRRDPKLPPVLRTGRRRFIAMHDIEVRQRTPAERFSLSAIIEHEHTHGAR